MLGKPVPDFSLPSTGGGTFKLSSARGSRLVPLFLSEAQHARFLFESLSDADETACKLFGVVKMKNRYGKKVRGIERSTFLIDEERRAVREWRGVKVPGHVQEVLNFAKAL